MVARKKTAPRVKAGTTVSAKEERRGKFVEAMLSNGGNITKAGVACGYSPRTAAQQGSRLLKEVKTHELLAARRAELSEKLQLSTEDVLRSLGQAVKFDPRKLFNADGSTKLPHELDEETAGAISGIDVEIVAGKVVGAKYKAVEKNAARDQALKHFGLYKADNIQRTPLDGLPRETLKAIVERLGGVV